MPSLEHPVTWSGHDYVLDAAFVDVRIDVEFDDDATHTATIDVQRDKDRDRRGGSCGWQVLRAHQAVDIEEFARDAIARVQTARRRAA